MPQLYSGLNSTGAQQAGNYDKNLHAYGYIGNQFNGPNTTGGQEAYNYSQNLQRAQNPYYDKADPMAWMFQGGSGGDSGSDASGPPQAVGRSIYHRTSALSHPPATQAPPPPNPAPPVGNPSQPPIGNANGPGIAPVQSTIDGNSPIYSPDQTHQYANQMASQARQLGNPRMAMKGVSRPGMSHDEGTMAAAMPQITAARSTANNIRGQVPLNDAFANQNYQLQGQVQAGQETNSLANLLQQLQQTQDTERNSAVSALLNPALGSIFG